jgi:MoaA/NifB/PqqE/SkfB family radical SAM enzyme
MKATLAFHLTDRCQLDCQHCLRDPARAPHDLPLAAIERALDDARRYQLASHVALTGGEPTLHPEFERVLDAIVERGFTWHMVSNGRRFARVLERIAARPERRAAFTAVDLSLDGASQATHDAIRGEGSWRDVMAAASICVERALPFVLQMTLHARNVAEIEAMGLLASQLGAARLSFAMMQPTGTHHDAALFLPAREWLNVQDRITRLAAALTLPVSTPEGFRVDNPQHACAPFRGEQLHVDVHGRLNLCCQHADVPSETQRDVAGDVRELGLLAAQRRMLDIINEEQLARLDAIARGYDEWDWFPCNRCMRSFGKPHWAADGAAGPSARRERWQLKLIEGGES